MNDEETLEFEALGLNVSRETQTALTKYCELVKKWNKSINLVSIPSLKDLWTRHILDSAQLLSLIDQDGVRIWLDIGSGGGFPGLVIGIIAQYEKLPFKVSLLESDARKCAFLRTVCRELSLDCDVLNERIEVHEPRAADVISARALADLDVLIPFIVRHGHSKSISLLPKGKSYESELTKAQRSWSINVEVHPSLTDPVSRILKIEGIPVARC